MDFLEEDYNTNKDVHQQCYLLFKTTEAHYGLESGRKRFMPIALDFLQKWESTPTAIDHYNQLKANIALLDKIKASKTTILGHQGDVTLAKKAVQNIFSVEIEESEEIIIKLLDSPIVDNYLKKYILTEFFNNDTYFTFHRLVEKVTQILTQWTSEESKINNTEIEMLKESYLNMLEEIKEWEVKYERFRSTGYWED
ncbi:hypothetical protein BKI52_10075 [marine bacterium AO1-C]|nr:hypothetical protein BKI52_10075 [marine bacterium AO1-C]